MKVSQLNTTAKEKNKKNNLNAVVNGSLSLGAQALYIIIAHEFRHEPVCADVLANFASDDVGVVQKKLSELEKANLINRHMSKVNGKFGKLQFRLSSSSKEIFNGDLVSREEISNKLMNILIKANIYQLFKEGSDDAQEIELLDQVLKNSQKQASKSKYLLERITKQNKERI